jgi:hypothetical protein
MRQLFLCHIAYFLHFSAPVLKLVIANYIITDFSPAVNQKSRNFQSRPLYIKYSVLPAYRKPSIKSAVYYAKTVFAFFISAFYSLFAIFISAILSVIAIFILQYYHFSALFAIPIPIFAHKNPAPETSGAGKLPISIASLTHSCQDL